MLPWTLVIFLVTGYGVSATSVDGFTKAGCEAAAKVVYAESGGRAKASCVERK